MVTVLITCFRQFFQLFQEYLRIKRNRFADVDQLVISLFDSLFCHKFFFVKFFTRTKSCIFELNIHIRFKSGETDQVAGKCIDFDCFTHIQYEDFTAPGISSCLKDEADCLRDRHKVTNNVRMCDGHRTACFDLFTKQRNHRTIAAQNISETYCYILGSFMIFISNTFDIDDAVFRTHTICCHMIQRISCKLTINYLIHVGM